MHKTPVSQKNIHFTIFCDQTSNQTLRLFVSFQKKKSFSPQKMFMSCLCLCHGTYLNGTCTVFVNLLIIFSGTVSLKFWLSEITF